MKIEAVTVCINYSDFLAHTILFNKPQFDRLLVVTDTKDQRTRDLCEFHHVECFSTDVFYHDDKALDKGAGISEGLKRLSGDDWIVHVDADIALPPRTRAILSGLTLDPSHLYGCDRMMCPSFDDWAAFVGRPEVQHSCDIYVQANAFALGTRIARMHAGGSGYLPIGYFQMWNAGKTKVLDYPSHGQADRSDMAFAQRWPRDKRSLLPELVAVHLEESDSDSDGEMGVNWRGRRSPGFGPSRHHGHRHKKRPPAPPVPPQPYKY